MSNRQLYIQHEQIAHTPSAVWVAVAHIEFSSASHSEILVGILN